MKTLGRSFMLAVPAIGLTVACGVDSDTLATPAVEQVILTPASASAATGDTRQFSVTGRLSDGRTVAVTVTYSATGGTITNGGVYTAGSVPGTYRVTASLSGGALADTSDITVTQSGVHNHYTTSFPLTENPISEGSRWINGGTVGLDWSNVSTTPALAIGHESGASYTDATALLTGTWGPDQEVSATVYAVSPNDACYQEVELRLRSAISPHVNRGYEISYKSSQSSSAYLIIVRWDGAWGDFHYIQTGRWDGAQYGVKTGDVVRATIVGNVITAYKNGVQLAQVTDGTFTTGNPGMGFNLENAPAGCTGTNANYGFTRFTAADSVAH